MERFDVFAAHLGVGVLKREEVDGGTLAGAAHLNTSNGVLLAAAIEELQAERLEAVE